MKKCFFLLVVAFFLALLPLAAQTGGGAQGGAQTGGAQTGGAQTGGGSASDSAASGNYGDSSAAGSSASGGSAAGSSASGSSASGSYDADEDEDAGFDDFRDFGASAGITVTGKNETPVQKQVITREKIERIAAPDVATLLEEALDMPVTKHGAYGNSSDVNMRGFSTERIAILIDGVPANSAMSGGFDFFSLPMNNIERIEVIYGGGDSKYNVSGALGGVINIITKRKQAQGWRFGFGVSNLGYWPQGYTEWSGKKKDAAWQDLADTQKLDASLSWGGAAIFRLEQIFFQPRRKSLCFY
ncbi:MAG: hypothetical protein Pg6A_20410 [Termitinemataceae bacterium]|nr:MAG: hypothetical protein Pg6A_20410 [Termitinemataceae bacterium]